jgi:hypothetical protein
MKLIVSKTQLGEAPESWLRHAGYAFIPEREDGELSFARRLTRDFYPRFHVYFKVEKDPKDKEKIIFNLHLDQKRPGYQGFNRHNAEYDGEVVEREIERLKSFLTPDIFLSE